MSHCRIKSCQRGFTLVELMIAVAIALFLLLGFTVASLNMQRTFTAQDQLAQLQDNERLAIKVLSSTVQLAGYFPDPLVSTAADSLPAASGTFGSLAAGQGIVGTTGASGASDTLTTRYVSTSGDGLMNCLGQSNTSGANAVVLNTFSVSSSKTLMCSTDGGATTTALVSSVSALSVVYGTDTDGNGSPDRYLSAAAVTASSSWPQVKVARLTLTFLNPYAGQPGQPATIDWAQTINLMNRT
jgi:type IV pilus assembly protein PilW